MQLAFFLEPYGVNKYSIILKCTGNAHVIKVLPIKLSVQCAVPSEK